MIDSLDHLVLTVADIGETVNFYQRVLGMGHEHFGNGRIALVFGKQKLNLHQAGGEFFLQRMTSRIASNRIRYFI